MITFHRYMHKRCLSIGNHLVIYASFIHRSFRHAQVASESRWIICVPKRASLPAEALNTFDDQDVAAYILVPQDEEGGKVETMTIRGSESGFDLFGHGLNEKGSQIRGNLKRQLFKNPSYVRPT